MQTINRIIDMFPPHQQAQVRAQLSLILQAVISQQLIPRRDGRGRVLAVEVMIPNPAIRNLIREDKIHQIYSQMQVGQAKFGMQTMNQSLLDLYTRKLISYEEAMGHATEPDELRPMLGVPGRMSAAAGLSRWRPQPPARPRDAIAKRPSLASALAAAATSGLGYATQRTWMSRPRRPPLPANQHNADDMPSAVTGHSPRAWTHRGTGRAHSAGAGRQSTPSG